MCHGFVQRLEVKYNLDNYVNILGHCLLPRQPYNIV